jgi:hypothetical protein
VIALHSSGVQARRTSAVWPTNGDDDQCTDSALNAQTHTLFTPIIDKKAHTSMSYFALAAIRSLRDGCHRTRFNS